MIRLLSLSIPAPKFISYRARRATSASTKLAAHLVAALLIVADGANDDLL